MARWWNGVSAILLIGFINNVTIGSEIPYTQDSTRLLSNLLEDYHPDVTPMYTNGEPVMVDMGMSLISFHFIDEANGLMSIQAWLKLAWYDYRLRWNPEAYGNINVVRVDPNDLWLPDIVVYNGVKVNKVMDHKAILYKTGYIYNQPSYRIEAKCVMNLRYFPYDEQRCWLKYGSWAHDSSTINIVAMAENLEVDEFHPSHDFILLNTSLVKYSVKYPCCDEIYEDMIYTLMLKRSSGAYSAKLILPSVLSGLMVLATFLLPPASLLLLLVYLQSIVPASGDTIIGEYLAFALCIDFFATILAVISYVLYGCGSKPMNADSNKGDDHDLRIETSPSTKRRRFRFFDLASFVIFSIVFLIGAAIMLGRRG